MINMQFDEDYEKRIQNLERRVLALKSIINGTSRNKPGRKPLLSAGEKADIIRKHNEGSSFSCLAAEYGGSKTTISNICHFDKGGKNFIIPVQRG